ETPPPPKKLFMGSYEQPRQPTSPEGPGAVLVVGTLKDGTAIDLIRRGMKIDWGEPDLETIRQFGGPWQPLVFSLLQSGAAKHMLPGFARFQLEEWNARHRPDEQVDAVEVVQVKPEALTGGPIRAEDRKVLAGYKREAERP